MASYNIITNIVIIIIVTRRRGVRGRCKGHSTGIDVGLTGLRLPRLFWNTICGCLLKRTSYNYHLWCYPAHQSHAYLQSYDFYKNNSNDYSYVCAGVLKNSAPRQRLEEFGKSLFQVIYIYIFRTRREALSVNDTNDIFPSASVFFLPRIKTRMKWACFL